jgi:hypothetical protein
MFIEGVGQNILLPDGSVDLVLCYPVIEHVRDVPKVIAENEPCAGVRRSYPFGSAQLHLAF